MSVETLEHKLREHPFLADLDHAQVAFMVGCARNARYPAGSFVFREGEPADELFLIRSGRMTLEIHDSASGTVQVESLGPGELVGWSWLYPPYRWHLDARATEEVRAFVFDGACLREKLEHDHDLGYAILKKLLYTLHERLARVRVQRLDVYGPGRLGGAREG